MATHLNTDSALLDKNKKSEVCAFLAAGTGVEIGVRCTVFSEYKGQAVSGAKDLDLGVIPVHVAPRLGRPKGVHQRHPVTEACCECLARSRVCDACAQDS